MGDKSPADDKGKVQGALDRLKETLKGQERTDAEDLLCRAALEGIYNYHLKHKQEK